MRHIIYLLLGIALAGCGTTPSVKLASSPIQENASFLVLDERPVKQKHSYSEESVDGKNQYFGDDNFKPAGPELLKASLQKTLDPKLSGTKVSLTNFVVSVYEPSISVDQNGLNTAAASVPNGYAAAPLAELLILAIEGAKSEKNVLVQISGNIDNSSFSASLSENFKGRVTENNIEDTVNKALDDVVSQIKATLATQ